VKSGGIIYPICETTATTIMKKRDILRGEDAATATELASVAEATGKEVILLGRRWWWSERKRWGTTTNTYGGFYRVRFETPARRAHDPGRINNQEGKFGIWNQQISKPVSKRLLLDNATYTSILTTASSYSPLRFHSNIGSVSAVCTYISKTDF
jgi:hypothetical protein